MGHKKEEEEEEEEENKSRLRKRRFSYCCFVGCSTSTKRLAWIVILSTRLISFRCSNKKQTEPC